MAVETGRQLDASVRRHLPPAARHRSRRPRSAAQLWRDAAPPACRAGRRGLSHYGGPAAEPEPTRPPRGGLLHQRTPNAEDIRWQRRSRTAARTVAPDRGLRPAQTRPSTQDTLTTLRYQIITTRFPPPAPDQPQPQNPKSSASLDPRRRIPGDDRGWWFRTGQPGATRPSSGPIATERYLESRTGNRGLTAICD
jgi:hypothetical protein